MTGAPPWSAAGDPCPGAGADPGARGAGVPGDPPALPVPARHAGGAGRRGHGHQSSGE